MAKTEGCLGSSALDDMVMGQSLTNQSDVLPWQCHARYRDMGNDALFIDIDYPDLIEKKRAIVLQTPELRDLLGDDFTVSEDKDGVLLRSDKYCQLGCDLRQLDRLRDVLKTVVDLPECAILFVAEVSITYMDTLSTDSLIQWASTVGRGLSASSDFTIPRTRSFPQ
ncbi:hypothetical protein ACHAPX_007591 [Trichoderma viride]